LKYKKEIEVEQSFDIILPAAQLEGTSALLAKWLVAVGDRVSEGEPIIELETDKVSMEICAPNAGVLIQIIAKEGEDIIVDNVLGKISNSVEHKSITTTLNNDEISTQVKHNDDQVVDILLPAAQLEGTSATLAKWLINIGDKVNEGAPIIELETDKVSMEICAPITGILIKVVANEGETIVVDNVLGQITTSQVNAEKPKQTSVPSTLFTGNTTEQKQTVSQSDNNSAQHLIGPAVRRLVKEHDLNLDVIVGTGRRGRITRNDVLAYLANSIGEVSLNEAAALTNKASNKTASATMPYAINQPQARALQGTMVPHTNMRKAIANHMVSSLLETSPHVTSIFEMDMSNIIEHRKWHKKEFAQHGAKLTFTAYFLAAIVQAAQAVPQVNARFHENALELFSDINIGVGTALGDAGLVVPVVQQVQSMSLFDIANALTAQTEKARSGKLTPIDMKYGTFTISNHGVSGSLIATPIIINQPQVAILGVGKLEKRVVVEDVAGVETMVIRPKCYVSLSIDHRALDAHQTNLFLAKFVEVIEVWGE